MAWPLPLKARSRASSTSASLTESDTKPFDLRWRRLGRRFDSPLAACCEVVKVILGDGERVRERERDERSEGVESECEARVKASFGGMVIVEIVTQGTLSNFFMVSRCERTKGMWGRGMWSE